MNPFKAFENLTSAAQSMPSLDRRSFLQRSGGAAVALVPLAGMVMAAENASAATNTDIDGTILNFALNLEYLEAEYYLYATTGMGLEGAGVATTGTGKTGSTIVTANSKVNFTTPLIQQYATEIAADEVAHVKYLRARLGNGAVARPKLDLLHSFNTLAQAAGIADTFNPFANEINFLLGAFIFEDVGVTAYHGAAASITNKSYLTAAAGIMGTEAYHASEVRTVLLSLDAQDRSAGISATVRKISQLRAKLNPNASDDQSIQLGGVANIVPTDPNGLVYARTVQEVLNIVYGGGSGKGLFYPYGMN